MTNGLFPNDPALVREGWTTQRDVQSRNVPLVVSFGGGVDSSAMVILMLERGIRPDAVVFADTMGEKPETYEYVGQFRRWLEGHGLALTIVRNSDSSKYASLEEACLVMKTLPSRAFGFSSCALKWKQDPQAKWANNWPPTRAAWDAGHRPIKAIGYDGGELRRASIQSDRKWRYWYPLIEWDVEREDCIAAIQRAGLPVPPKSACWFCPSSKKHEVVALKARHPDLFARAVAMEANAAENLGSVRGLGRDWSWRALGEMDDRQRALLREQPVEACLICADGDACEVSP